MEVDSKNEQGSKYNVPLYVVSFLNAVVPIHNADSIIIYSHVFRCDKTAVHDILSLRLIWNGYISLEYG